MKTNSFTPYWVDQELHLGQHVLGRALAEGLAVRVVAVRAAPRAGARGEHRRELLVRVDHAAARDVWYLAWSIRSQAGKGISFRSCGGVRSGLLLDLGRRRCARRCLRTRTSRSRPVANAVEQLGECELALAANDEVDGLVGHHVLRGHARREGHPRRSSPQACLARISLATSCMQPAS